MELRQSLCSSFRDSGDASFPGKMHCVMFNSPHRLRCTHACPGGVLRAATAEAQESHLARPFGVVTKCIYGRSNTDQPLACCSHLPCQFCSTNEVLRLVYTQRLRESPKFAIAIAIMSPSSNQIVIFWRPLVNL